MGKGSSKGHTPREAKDNLKSSQMLSVIDAISEGPVEGPVDGLKSVLLNSTPVLDSEGNTNIIHSWYRWELRRKRWFGGRLCTARWCACSVALSHTASRVAEM